MSQTPSSHVDFQAALADSLEQLARRHRALGNLFPAVKDVQGYKVGDRMVGDSIISCHSCPACLPGHINVCNTLKLLGVDLDGGFGQCVASPASPLYSLPDAILVTCASMVKMYGLRYHVL
ncbi:MAG: alcohol dehydrogenase catalytic domain-containing protein [Anaerolineae bacterium]|nr:alcohol dehydrogenase catalytic domain-containing protein [Anaerolineae bacterium]